LNIEPRRGEIEKRRAISIALVIEDDAFEKSGVKRRRAISIALVFEDDAFEKSGVERSKAEPYFLNMSPKGE
jgi:hypothetical protein